MNARISQMISSTPFAIAACAMVATLALGPVAHADVESWKTNFIDARAAASEGEKDMLLLFTGSDWCPPCMALESEVLSQEAFNETTSVAFVPVLLDYPRGKPQDDATRQQNSLLQSIYKIQGYPTLMLTDAKGLAYAKVGYDAGLAARGPAAYAAHLMQMRSIRRARDQAFAQAQTVSGIERARALDRGLDTVGPELAAAFYSDVMRDVLVLDPEDQAGLKTKYEQMVNRQALEEAFNGAIERLQSGQIREGLDHLNAMIADHEPTGDMLQHFEFMRGQAHALLTEPEQAQAAFERSIAASPTSPAVPEIREMMKNAAALGQ